LTLRELQDQGYNITRREYMALHGRVTQELKTALDESRRKLRKLYDKLDSVKPEDYYVTAVKFNRLTRLQDDLIRAYNAAARRSGTVIQNAAEVAISNAYYRQQFAMVLGTSVLDNVDMVFTVLPSEVIEASVYGTATKIRERFGKASDYIPQSGTFLERVLDRNRQADVDKIRTAVTQALTLGEGYQKAARRVKDILDTTATNAERIIRTEGHRNQVAGQYAMTQEARAQGVEVTRRIESVLDDRTRPQSVQVDGRYENDEGYFEYPGGALVKMPGNSGVAGWDINDREAVIDIIEGVEPTVRRARDPVTGETEIISYRSFNEWAAGNGLRKNRYGQWVG
jgi:AraC-like DNA-binding protein